MNYYEARERSDKSGWAWTVMNDSVIRTAGGCVTWPDGVPTVQQSLAGDGPRPGEPHAHATREEAERCFYEHEVANLRETSGSADMQRRCQYADPRMVARGKPESSCPNWTQKGLESRHLGDADLCDEHRDADGWQAVHPFRPGLAITSSY